MGLARRRIVLYIAVTADGYIARQSGAIDWLPEPRPGEDYGWRDFRESVDAAILGRRTYEGSLAMGAAFTPTFPHYVFSRDPSRLSKASGVQFVTELSPAFLRDVRAQPGKNIFLVGGAALISLFLDAGGIDEFIITTIPILIGEGIPLFRGHRGAARLSLRASRSFSDGVVQTHYDVPVAEGV